jgi:uncharacterized membrane protein YjjP (DUF1212 family)
MTFLDFYTFDITQFVIICLVAFGVFMLFNYFEKNKKEKYTFNITLSIVAGILTSFIYSYFTIEPDILLTTNYWD